MTNIKAHTITSSASPIESSFFLSLVHNTIHKPSNFKVNQPKTTTKYKNNNKMNLAYDGDTMQHCQHIIC